MENYFLKMIKTLRSYEEVILSANIFEIHQEEQELVLDFLRNEYKLESTDYPFVVPEFNDRVGIWAAKTVYNTAQLILYRKNKPEELSTLLPEYKDIIDAAAILSADICLRFIPDMLIQLKLIDPEDELISVLENILHNWHYSGINYNLQITRLDFAIVNADNCLNQLYINRIIENKKNDLAILPQFKVTVQAVLGLYATQFWDTYKPQLYND